MRHPSHFLSAGLSASLRSSPGLLLLGLLTLALGEPMRAHSDALITAKAPYGILSMQFACAAETAGNILSSWNAAALAHAKLSLLWDSGFAPAYGIALSSLSERVVSPPIGSGGRWASLFVWLPLWAAASDLLENLFHFCLIGVIDCGLGNALPSLACGFASIKWSLLAIWLMALTWLAARAMVARASGR